MVVVGEKLENKPPEYEPSVGVPITLVVEPVAVEVISNTPSELEEIVTLLPATILPGLKPPVPDDTCIVPAEPEDSVTLTAVILNLT